MTKKDFILIAKVIGKVQDNSQLSALICDFADELKKTNVLFNFDRFSHAAHLEHIRLYGR